MVAQIDNSEIKSNTAAAGEQEESSNPEVIVPHDSPEQAASSSH